jgi:hypothetical protein
LSGLDRVFLHFEDILRTKKKADFTDWSMFEGYMERTYLAILLDISSANALSGQLSTLAHGNKCSTEAQSKDRSENEPPCIGTDNHVNLL